MPTELEVHDIAKKLLESLFRERPQVPSHKCTKRQEDDEADRAQCCVVLDSNVTLAEDELAGVGHIVFISRGVCFFRYFSEDELLGRCGRWS